MAATDGDYFRLVLLVGPAGSGKTRRLKRFAADHAYPLVPMGRTCASRLLDVPERQRRLRAAELIATAVNELTVAATVILLDDIELLFATSLALDPLKLLQSLARNRTVLASWAGSFAEGILSYAEPSHPEYRAYHHPEAVVVLAGPPSAPVT